jgi:NAD+ diphosphatase
MFLRLDNIARSIQFRHARDKVTQIPLPPLARSALDRDYLLRTQPDLMSSLRARPESMALLMHRGKVRLQETSGPELLLTPLSKAPQSEVVAYLGKSSAGLAKMAAGVPVCLVVLDQTQADSVEPNSQKWVSLRATGAGLSDFDAGIFTQGLALSNWHHHHSKCPRCGGPTEIEQAGWVRRCKIDDLELYPRTDPAVIVSIIDQHDRILLGSQGTWEHNRWSILAGFVEPGESLEAAVLREMHEETGLVVNNPKYIYSQSWPFPCSLMLGFTASADSSQQLKPDGQEIVRLRWFSRDEIADESSQIILPTKTSIARGMIELWFGSKLVSSNENPGHGSY